MIDDLENLYYTIIMYSVTSNIDGKLSSEEEIEKNIHYAQVEVIEFLKKHNLKHKYFHIIYNNITNFKIFSKNNLLLNKVIRKIKLKSVTDD
jgi:hypothetical protein